MSQILLRAYCRTPEHNTLSMWEVDPFELEHEGQVERFYKTLRWRQKKLSEMYSNPQYLS